MHTHAAQSHRYGATLDGWSCRLPFGKEGPDPRPRPPLTFRPVATTRAAFAAARRVLPDLPGRLETFAWPVTRQQALAALDDFITHRLAQFGPFEDAMWTSEPTLYHSRLSSSLNLKLLRPRECRERAIEAYRAGKAPLRSVEAFVRQIIGWREFIRGVYWLDGPTYADRNGLDQHGQLPPFYWTADTDMACMSACIGQVLDTGFGHHIQRLMVSGKYMERMSNYCTGCRYDPAVRSGPSACPFTAFYWDFLIRARETLSQNQRMAMILKNVDRMTPQARTQIRIDADRLRKKFGIDSCDRR